MAVHGVAVVSESFIATPQCHHEMPVRPEDAYTSGSLQRAFNASVHHLLKYCYGPTGPPP